VEVRGPQGLPDLKGRRRNRRLECWQLHELGGAHLAEQPICNQLRGPPQVVLGKRLDVPKDFLNELVAEM